MKHTLHMCLGWLVRVGGSNKNIDRNGDGNHRTAVGTDSPLSETRAMTVAQVMSCSEMASRGGNLQG